MRLATFLLRGLDTLAWLLIAAAAFLSQSDPATRALDMAAGTTVTLLFVITVAPALVLALAGRAPRAALWLAGAFPAAFALLFVAAVIAFA